MSKPDRARTAKSPLDHDPEELRRRRVASGLRLVDVAERTGLAYGHIAELERGTRNPSPPALLALAEALGCTTVDLMSKPALPVPIEVG